MLVEQTQIAKQLGISMNALHRILRTAGLETEEHFKLINKKRNYNLDEVLAVIKRGQSNG
jgi:DNA-binding phage protein